MVPLNNQLLQSLKLLVHLFTYLHVDSCIAISVTYCPIILQFFFIMYSTLYFKCVIFTKPDTAAFEKDIRILPKVNKVFGILKKNYTA